MASDTTDWDGVSGVVDEIRDARTYSDVVLPFTAKTNLFVVQGTRFSVGGFELLRQATDVTTGDQVMLDHRAFSKSDQPFNLRIMLSGFVLELAVRAGFVGMEGEGDDARLLFAITEMSPREEQALRRVIRAYLNGQIASADDVLRAMDAPTGTGKPAPKPVVNVPPSKWKSRAIAAVSSLACAAVLSLSLVSLYDKYMIIESDFATITAPSVDILSPGTGKLDMAAPQAGGRVGRDSPLFVVQAPELDAEIELSRARIDYLGAARERREANRITNPRDVSALDPAQAEAVLVPTFDAAAEKRIFDELSLEMGHLAALKLRKAGLQDFAPCDCVVSWAEENGAWVAAGDPLLTLAKSGTGDLAVEALVKLKYAMEIEPGQSAYVRLRNSKRLVPAVVEAVMLEDAKRPRIGFPKWLRQDHSLGAVTLNVSYTLSAEDIGVPVDVFITDQLPVLEQLKLFWAKL